MFTFAQHLNLVFLFKVLTRRIQTLFVIMLTINYLIYRPLKPQQECVFELSTFIGYCQHGTNCICVDETYNFFIMMMVKCFKQIIKGSTTDQVTFTQQILLEKL